MVADARLSLGRRDIDASRELSFMTDSNDVWRAIVTFDSTAPLTLEQAEALALWLPASREKAPAEVTQDARGTHLSFTVQTLALRSAQDMVQAAADGAWSRLFGVVAQVIAVRILPEHVYQDQLAHPDPLDLVGIAEITEMISQRGKPVTRQRAQQITVLAGFPAPVTHLKATKVYTRTSVNLFLDWWAAAGRVSGRHLPADFATAKTGRAAG
jgi:hypothetical protein